MRWLFALLAATAVLGHASNWTESVDSYLAAAHTTRKSPDVLARTVSRAFLEDLPHQMRITAVSDTNSETDIFVSDSVIYVRSSPRGWNLVAIGDSVYEWESGSPSGIRLQRNDRELLEYLHGLIDPGYILLALYAMSEKTPADFAISSANGIETRRLVGANPPMTLLVKRSPFWIRGFDSLDPATGRTASFRVSDPAKIDEMPPEISKILRTIVFENSSLSLRRHLSFL